MGESPYRPWQKPRGGYYTTYGTKSFTTNYYDQLGIPVLSTCPTRPVLFSGTTQPIIPIHELNDNNKPFQRSKKNFCSRNKIKSLNFGTYNVRTLKDVGKITQIAVKANELNLDFIGIQEHRRIIKDKYTCYTNGSIQYDFFHSSANKKGGGGVGIFIKKIHVPYIRNIDVVSERIFKITLNYNPLVTIYSVYAPTLGTNEDAKNKFYTDINNAINGSNCCLTIVLGDFNARIAKNNDHPINAKSVYSIHQNTDCNGEMLLNLCAEHALTPISLNFLHKRSRKITWTHPKTNQGSEIDHILITNKYNKYVTNCRSYTSFNFGSDHFVKAANMQIKIKKPRINRSSVKTYAYDLLKTKEYADGFKLELRNRFEQLKDECDTGTNAQNIYDALEESIKDTSTKLLRRDKYKNTHWITEETLKLMGLRDKARMKYLSTKNCKDKIEFTRLKTQAKRAIKDDKDKMFDNILKTAEESRKKNNTRQLYRLIRMLGGNFKHKLNINVEKDDDHMEVWRKHFSDILNSENGKTSIRRKRNVPTLNIDTQSFTIGELKQAIKECKNNKAPGIDNIKSEVLKILDDDMVNVILGICNDVYEKNIPPEQWIVNAIIPIHKKGDKSNVTNYRGVSLMSAIAKIYNKMLLNRIYVEVNKTINHNQAGFRRKRTTIEQVHVVRRIIEDANLNDKKYSMVFIDFQKAFDSIDRKAMINILRNIGIPEKIVRAIACMYDKTINKVCINGIFTKEFETKTGILQGDTLAPFLFIVVMDYVLKQVSPARKGNGYQFADDLRIHELLYADDLVLISEKPTDIVKYVKAIIRETKKIGLKINCAKSKYITNLNKEKPEGKKLKDLDALGIEEVKEFKYLGCYVSDISKEMDERKTQTWLQFRSLYKIWKDSSVSNETKIRMVKTLLLPIYMYGSETWTLKDKDIEKINIFGRKLFRSALNIRMTEKVKNETLYEMCKTVPLYDAIKERQKDYIERITAHQTGDIYKIIMTNQNFKKKLRRGAKTNQEYLNGIIEHGEPDGA